MNTSEKRTKHCNVCALLLHKYSGAFYQRVIYAVEQNNPLNQGLINVFQKN